MKNQFKTWQGKLALFLVVLSVFPWFIPALWSEKANEEAYNANMTRIQKRVDDDIQLGRDTGGSDAMFLLKRDGPGEPGGIKKALYMSSAFLFPVAVLQMIHIKKLRRRTAINAPRP